MIHIIKEYIQEPWLVFSLLAVIATFIGVLIRFVFFKVLSLLSDEKNRPIVKKLSYRFKNSLFLFIPLIIILTNLNSIGFSEAWVDVAKPILQIAIIVSFTIVSFKLIYFIQDVILLQYDLDAENNVRARQVATQVVFLRKISFFVIGVLTIAVILYQFDEVRKYGAALITSAGVAGLVIGFAAQKTIGNLLAGLQIAFTQPIKLDDALVVEGEWGWVEEINLTYVVLRIWDKRRLILPITYFTEKPFQNWTRNSADIMGSVFLYIDYTIPIEKLRTAFEGFLEETDLWDEKAQVLQVTDCKDRTMELRLLMTARNSPTAWDLRCFIREKMLVYIQENYPDALPKARISMEPLKEDKPDENDRSPLT